MLNSGYKKEALAEYERTGKAYKQKYDDTILNTTKLHNEKEVAVAILKNVETYINTLANKPKELEKTLSEIVVRRNAFEKEIDRLKIESKKSDQISKGVAGAGVAAFGPTAAMAIATTFGTASTGTAIATL